MRVYVASPWKFKDDARVVAVQLRDIGYTVTSVWHDDHPDTQDPVELAREAQTDFMGVVSADVLLVLNREHVSEGKAVEQGIAIGFQVPIIAVGSRRQNVFQYLPVVTLVPTLEAAIEELRKIEKAA